MQQLSIVIYFLDLTNGDHRCTKTINWLYKPTGGDAVSNPFNWEDGIEQLNCCTVLNSFMCFMVICFKCKDMMENVG